MTRTFEYSVWVYLAASGVVAYITWRWRNHINRELRNFHEILKKVVRNNGPPDVGSDSDVDSDPDRGLFSE